MPTFTGLMVGNRLLVPGRVTADPSTGQSRKILFLVDTGAKGTHVDVRALRSVGAAIVGKHPVQRAHDQIIATQHAARIELILAGGTPIFENVVMAWDVPPGYEFTGLLGMDLLQRCTLAFRGPQKSFSLAYG